MYTNGGVDMKEEKLEILLVDESVLQGMIYSIRGQKVMLDVDLAQIYGYETKNFNRQVKNNIAKFEGEDFMFQLTSAELQELSRCKNCTLNKSQGRGNNIKYNPYAFTEQGIYMLMTVLRGDLAIQQSRALIRTFKRMKDFIVENQMLVKERENIQDLMLLSDNIQVSLRLRADLNEVEDQLADVMDRLNNVVLRSDLSRIMNEFGEVQMRRGYLFYNGQPFKAVVAYDEIYRQAVKSIYVVDNYIGMKTLVLLLNVAPNIEIKIFSDNLANGLRKSVYDDFRKEYSGLNVKLYESGGIFHDRYIILDYGMETEKIFHCGASSKDAGAKVSSILEDPDTKKYETLIENLLQSPKLKLT